MFYKYLISSPKVLLLVVAALFCSFIVQAQGEGLKVGKLSGRVINDQKKPVPYITVTLLQNGGSVVGGDLTGDDGNFNIEYPAAGVYTLKMSGIGITTTTIDNITIEPGATEKKVGNVRVTGSSQMMDEVQITAERALMEMSVDKKTFNVEKNITTAGGSASDVLQNVPSLSVDVDGNVSMRGKSNITILIDGKPATLLGGDAASALQSLPASSVQSVEVITNPSAKYDAQGMGGIVNIVTKKDKKLGLNGSVTAGVGTRDKYNGGINLNLKNEKWNVFLNSNFRLNRNLNSTEHERINRNSDISFSSFENGTRRFNGWFNTIGAEYTIDDKNSVTLTQNVNLMQWGNKSQSDYTIYSAPGQVSSIQRRYSDNLGGPLSLSTSLDYKHKFAKPKEEVTANITFANSRVQREQTYTTQLLDGNSELLSNPIFQNAPGEGGNRSLNGQVDYTTPFLSKTGKLDAGLKTQLFWFDSENDPILDSGDGIHRDLVLLNIYNYTQQTHAAYTSFGDQKGNWSYNGGLRLEYATYEGEVNTAGKIRYTNEFLSLFPSVFASYKLPEDQSVYISYTRRTDRPSFWQMMPYLDVSNPQDTSMGNPNLIPEFINNTELNYNKQFKKGHNIIAGVYYQYTRNLIERYRRFYPDGTSFVQHQNLNSGVTYGAELTGRLQLLPIWDATLNVNLFQNEIEGTNIDPSLNNSGFSWFGKVNTSVRLPHGFSVQVNGNYEAPKVAAQGTLQDVYWLDIALRKSLLKNRANIVLNVSDIFDTRKYTTVYDFMTYTQTTYRNRETRVGNLTFTYRFGSSESKNNSSRRRQGNGAQERNNLKTDDSDQGGF